MRKTVVAGVLAGAVVAGVGVAPAWAQTISMGPQAMEGNLQLTPGTTLEAGYDFTMPGNHAAAAVYFVGAQVAFTAYCGNTPAGTVTVPLTAGPYNDPANDGGDWFPSSDQSSPSVYQGSVAVPNLCSGGKVGFQNGGTFSADLQSNDTVDSIHVRWHYSANGSSGSWSATNSYTADPVTQTPVGSVGAGALAAVTGVALVLRQRRHSRRRAAARAGA